MWNNRRLRLLGALFAFALFAVACGSDATTTVSPDTGQTNDDAVSDMADDAMDEDTDDEHSDDEHSDDEHDHGVTTIDVDTAGPVPEVQMTLNETAEPGVFDMTILLTNFTITPENVDGDPVDNEGHMHLLLDGEKVERFYELERQVTVPEGDHLVEVELNANNHSAYSIDGVAIRAGMTVAGAGTAQHDSEDDHSHGDGAAAVEDGLSAADADVSISASFDGGVVSLEGDERVSVAVDDVVTIMLTSDTEEEAHVHGYDILAEVVPGETATILFTADTAGRFEIEFEKSGAFIAELEVS